MSGQFKVGEIVTLHPDPACTPVPDVMRLSGEEVEIIGALNIYPDYCYCTYGYEIMHPSCGRLLAEPHELRRKCPPATGEDMIRAMFDTPPVDRRQPVTAWRARYGTAQALTAALSLSASNFVSQSICDRFNFNDVSTYKDVSIVEHTEKGGEIVSVHPPVITEHFVDVIGDLAYRGAQVKQLINEAGRGKLVHWDRVQVCEHVDEKTSVETAPAGPDVNNYLRIPLEFLHHVKHFYACVRCDDTCGSGGVKSCSRTIKFLQSSSVFKLTAGLGGRDLPSSQDCQYRPDSLNPTGKAIVFVRPRVTQESRYQRDSQGGNCNLERTTDVSHVCSKSFNFGIVA